MELQQASSLTPVSYPPQNVVYHASAHQSQPAMTHATQPERFESQVYDPRQSDLQASPPPSRPFVPAHPLKPALKLESIGVEFQEESQTSTWPAATNQPVDSRFEHSVGQSSQPGWDIQVNPTLNARNGNLNPTTPKIERAPLGGLGHTGGR